MYRKINNCYPPNLPARNLVSKCYYYSNFFLQNSCSLSGISWQKKNRKWFSRALAQLRCRRAKLRSSSMQSSASVLTLDNSRNYSHYCTPALKRFASYQGVQSHCRRKQIPAFLRDLHSWMTVQVQRSSLMGLPDRQGDQKADCKHHTEGSW